jgi:predicted transcriptional regulator
MWALVFSKKEGAEAMEVHFKPDVQAKLDQMARESGRPSEELVEDAVVGYFDELGQTREMLDRRFDDLESGRVKPIDGEEAYRRLMEKTEAHRRRYATPCVDLHSTPKRLTTLTKSANT